MAPEAARAAVQQERRDQIGSRQPLMRLGRTAWPPSTETSVTLPPYGPDLNPIEAAFSKLRPISAPPRPALFDASEEPPATSAISSPSPNAGTS